MTLRGTSEVAPHDTIWISVVKEALRFDLHFQGVRRKRFEALKTELIADVSQGISFAPEPTARKTQPNSAHVRQR